MITLNGVSVGFGDLTPAQVTGHPKFITDVPVQGPTDEGLRRADCNWTKQVVPAQPSCADCGGGPIPMWAQRSLSPVRGQGSGIGDAIALGGAPVRGFALAGPSDPEVWTKLTSAQQAWIMETLVKLDAQIRSTTGTSCPSWAPAVTAAGGCFQNWFNGANLGFTKPDGSPLRLRTDGTFDQDTLDALRTVAALYPKDFPTPFPGTALPGPVQEKKLSTGAIFGIAAGGLALVGGVAYAATRKKNKRG